MPPFIQRCKTLVGDWKHQQHKQNQHQLQHLHHPNTTGNEHYHPASSSSPGGCTKTTIRYLDDTSASNTMIAPPLEWALSHRGYRSTKMAHHSPPPAATAVAAVNRTRENIQQHQQSPIVGMIIEVPLTATTRTTEISTWDDGIEPLDEWVPDRYYGTVEGRIVSHKTDDSTSNGSNDKNDDDDDNINHYREPSPLLRRPMIQKARPLPDLFGLYLDYFEDDDDRIDGDDRDNDMSDGSESSESGQRSSNHRNNTYYMAPSAVLRRS